MSANCVCLFVQGYVDSSPESLLKLLIEDIEEIPSWNPACDQFEVNSLLHDGYIFPVCLFLS